MHRGSNHHLTTHGANRSPPFGHREASVGSGPPGRDPDSCDHDHGGLGTSQEVFATGFAFAALKVDGTVVTWGAT